MNLFDKASLILTPNADKVSKISSLKPTDGTGDFTFSRTGNATRVNSSGLIEAPRTNLITYSEDFGNVAWSKTNITVTTDTTTAPNGSLTADTIASNAASSFISISFTYSDPTTISFYLKYVNQQFVQIYSGASAAAYANFDLLNGIVGNKGASASTSSIISVGNSWYRCSVTFTGISISSNARIGFITSGTSTWGANNASGGTSFICWGAQAEASSTATDYIPTTTSARTTFAGITQNGTDASNIPRLNYPIGGGCPSILLEPSRTNSFINSIWAGGLPPTSWSYSNTNGTITAISSTLGTDSTALRFNNSGGGSLNIEYPTSYAASSYVISFNIESITGNLQYQELVRLTGGPSISSSSFFLNGVSVLASAQVAVGRFEYRFTLSSTGTYGARIGSGTGVSTPTANIIVLSRPQLEAGSYATSYIPTTTASVTRGVEVSTTANISKITGTSFTLAIKLKSGSNVSTGNPYLGVENVNFVDGVYLASSSAGSGNRWRSYIRISSTTTEILSDALGLTINDQTIVIKIDGTTAKVFLGGSLRATTTLPSNVAVLPNAYSNAAFMSFELKLFATYNSALTDAECIALSNL